MPLIISIIKFFLRIIYAFMKLRPVERKAVFLSRQDDEPSVDYSMLASVFESSGMRIEMLLQRQEKDVAWFVRNMGESMRMILRQMKALASARVAVTDGYSIPISILNHRKSLEVVQIWHAVGAMKKFGLQTLPSMNELERREAMVLKMHSGYSHFVAPSATSAKFFAEAFGMDLDKALITGTPYLDALHNGCFEKSDEILKAFPELAQNMSSDHPRKVILYVPTYRKGSGFKRAVRSLCASLDFEKYILVVKGHPVDVNTKSSEPEASVESAHHGLATIFAEDFLAEEIMGISDAVITDYSSLAIAAALTSMPLFFYVYDIDSYRVSPGLNIDPENEYSRYTARKAGDLARIIDASIEDLDSSSVRMSGIESAAEDAVPASLYDYEYEAKFAAKYIETFDGRCVERLAAVIMGFMIDSPFL